MTARQQGFIFGLGSGRRALLLPLLAFIGRRLWLYLALYTAHLVVAGVALALIAIRAGTGESDWIFWLAYGWIALQVLTGPRLFLPTALALTVVGVQATQGDRDGWFWLGFIWLCLMILGGGVMLRAARAARRRSRRGEPAASGEPEAVFATMFGERGFSWAQRGGGPAPNGDILDGTAHDVPPEED